MFFCFFFVFFGLLEFFFCFFDFSNDFSEVFSEVLPFGLFITDFAQTAPFPQNFARAAPQHVCNIFSKANSFFISLLLGKNLLISNMNKCTYTWTFWNIVFYYRIRKIIIKVINVHYLNIQHYFKQDFFHLIYFFPIFSMVFSLKNLNRYFVP